LKSCDAATPGVDRVIGPAGGAVGQQRHEREGGEGPRERAQRQRQAAGADPQNDHADGPRGHAQDEWLGKRVAQQRLEDRPADRQPRPRQRRHQSAAQPQVPDHALLDRRYFRTGQAELVGDRKNDGIQTDVVIADRRRDGDGDRKHKQRQAQKEDKAARLALRLIGDRHGRSSSSSCSATCSAP